jgi:hypothetical protein
MHQRRGYYYFLFFSINIDIECVERETKVFFVALLVGRENHGNKLGAKGIVGTAVREMRV